MDSQYLDTPEKEDGVRSDAYFLRYEKDLELLIQHNISKHAHRLYIFLSLNPHLNHLNDQQIAEKLGVHRTTILRARAELAAARLIDKKRLKTI